MRMLAAVIFLALCTSIASARGLFPHHHHDSGSYARSEGSVLPPVPEPETYLFMLIGVGLVAWIVRKNKK